MNITISSQFQDLIYPLTTEELTVLEQSILQHGVRDPLVVWENGKNYLIDGHHRWSIIKKHKISKYNVVNLKFDNKHEAINWMIDNQLGRRNSTPEGISYLRGLRYKNEKLQHGGNRKSSGNDFNLQKTSDMLGEQYKVTGRTIVNDEKFADAIETISKTFPTPSKQKDIKHKILTRQIDLSKKDLIELSELSAKYIKQVLDGEKELWQVKLEIEQNRKKNKKKPVRVVLPEEIKMYCGDCIDVMKKMESDTYSSAVLDPPYGWPLGKKINNFTPSEIDKYGLIEQAYFVGDRSPALKAGLYDLSIEGGKKYQNWCSKWGKELLRIIKPGGHVLVFCSTKMLHRLTIGLEECGWNTKNILTWNFGTGFPTSLSVSQQIDKMNGTNGKVVCENPNLKNRLRWDKKDKNVIAPFTSEAEEWDGWFNNIKNSFEPILLIRKPLSEKTVSENVLKWGTGALNIDACRIFNSEDIQNNNDSRFPSNVILNSEAEEELNRQAGLNVASYFYCPKPSETVKNIGCEDTGNTHPTIKPISLCSYLLKLITPPSGKVIDIFSGSGTMGMACAMNNMQYCGIEIEKDYYQLAKRRIMAAYRDNQ